MQVSGKVVNNIQLGLEEKVGVDSRILALAENSEVCNLIVHDPQSSILRISSLHVLEGSDA